jgi:hypothetical protein
MHRLRYLDFAKSLDGDPQPMEVDLTAEARQSWAAWVNAHGVTTAQLAGPAAAYASKVEGAAARLALVHWACRYVEGEAGERIDAEAIEAGVGLARWFLAEGLRVYATLGIDSASADQGAGELARWIATHHPHGATVRDVYSRGPRQFRNSPDEAEAALNGLAADGYGRWEVVPPPSGRGPATRVFVLAEPWLQAFNSEAATQPDVEPQAEEEAGWDAQGAQQTAEEPEPVEEPPWGDVDAINTELCEAAEADGADYWEDTWPTEEADDAQS